VEQLDLHRLIADLGLQTTDLFFVFIVLACLQRRLAAGEEVIAPAGHGGCGDTELARDDVDVLTSEQSKDGFGFAARRVAAAVLVSC
jgi:hypothetical protein